MRFDSLLRPASPSGSPRALARGWFDSDTRPAFGGRDDEALGACTIHGAPGQPAAIADDHALRRDAGAVGDKRVAGLGSRSDQRALHAGLRADRRLGQVVDPDAGGLSWSA
eukprot:1090112-Pyramimonas_sp.AAC.1